jgi:hypothetical protein
MELGTYCVNMVVLGKKKSSWSSDFDTFFFLFFSQKSFVRCMEAITLRLAKTKNATPSKRGIIILGILAKIPMIYNLILLVFKKKSCSMLKAMKKKEIYISFY